MTRKRNLSAADAHYIGHGKDPALWGRTLTYGVPMTPRMLVSLGTPDLADDALLIDAATSAELPAEAGDLVYAAADESTDSPLDGAAELVDLVPFGAMASVKAWDVHGGTPFGRNLVANATHNSAVVAMTITLAGYDYLNRPMSETLTVPATGTSQVVAGAKAFAYVGTMTIAVAADATTNTLSIGTGDALGLPYRLEKIGHLTQASLAGAQELINVASNATVVAAVTDTATATTGDVRGTITFNGTYDGTKEALIEMHVADPNSAEGVAGVAQA